MCWGGRLVTCGSTSGHLVEVNLRAVFFKGLSILGSTMGSLAELRRLLTFVDQGRLQPVVDRVLPFEQAALVRLDESPTGESPTVDGDRVRFDVPAHALRTVLLR